MKLLQGWSAFLRVADLGHVPMGSVKLVRQFMPFMYFGVIWMQEGQAEWQGEARDEFGNIRLSDIVVEDDVITFRMRYMINDGSLRPEDGIFYRFDKREGNTWVGECSHSSIESAPTRCIITDVDDELFNKDVRAFLEAQGAKYRTEQQELARLGATVDGNEPPSEFEERGRLIESMLDKIYPFIPGMPEDVRQGVENDRQMLVLRSEWGSMPIEKLREVAAR